MHKIFYPELPILLIDDEQEILDGCEFILQCNGFNNILTCQDSRDVMSLIQNREIVVVLLDLLMPGKSGQELLDTIRQFTPELPVIIGVISLGPIWRLATRTFYGALISSGGSRV